MRTYPENRDDGSLWGFEIPNTWIWIGSIERLLRSVPGASNIRRVKGDDRRIVFDLHEEKCVVMEPFGDNSRYWIGPEEPKSSTLDLGALREAFARYQSPIARFFNK
jgi:hypothetical protein